MIFRVMTGRHRWKIACAAGEVGGKSQKDAGEVSGESQHDAGEIGGESRSDAEEASDESPHDTGEVGGESQSDAEEVCGLSRHDAGEVGGVLQKDAGVSIQNPAMVRLVVFWWTFPFSFCKVIIFFVRMFKRSPACCLKRFEE
jgi:hypothetical protein